MTNTVKDKLKDQDNISVPSKSLTDEETKVQKYLVDRLGILKQTKQSIIGNIDFEQIMRSADDEYQPTNLSEKAGKSGNIMLVQDEIKGLRGSRIVPFGSGADDEAWRSDLSEPTLFVKIQTALSVIINQNPEAFFKATSPKFKKTTSLAKSLWKRNWAISNAKDQWSMFIFNLAKYGWSVGRTYPRQERFKVQILDELDVDSPDKNKYKETDITQFNDVYRETLDPYRTWIDDMTNLTDPWSTKDWYFEKDYTIDDFREGGQFFQYKNAEFVKATGRLYNEADSDKGRPNQQTDERTDVVTVGFYECTGIKDLYCIWIPKQNLPLFISPLPNDDKNLSLFWTYWNMRDIRTPYGIGLFEILRQNKVMYDRLENMDIDQLTMSIYTMLFVDSNMANGDNVFKIKPNVIHKKMPGTNVQQIQIARSDNAAAIQFQLDRMDENTGITPTLQGQVTGKTLGEVLQAKDSALKRLNIPLENIANAMSRDAQLTLSWMNQIYSIPEVKEFASPVELVEYEQENGLEASETMSTKNGKLSADFLPVLELQLENRDGELMETKENRFFKLGIDIDTSQVKWDGIVKIEPKSLLSPFPELEKQSKMELFNIIMPVVEKIVALVQEGNVPSALAFYKPLVQVLEANEEKPEDWIPENIVNTLKVADTKKTGSGQQLFVNPEQQQANQQGQEGQLQSNQPSNIIKDASKGIGNLMSSIKGGLKGGIKGGLK